MTGIWQAFCATVRERPEHPAVIHDGQPCSFAALHARALDYQAALHELDIKHNDRVLLSMSNSAEACAALLGTWAAGAIAALLDAGAPQSHLEHAAQLTAARVLILPQNRGPATVPHGLRVIAATDVARDAPAVPEARTLPTDAASIVFTSGSTGRPKGVVQSHGNLLRGCRAVAGYLGLAPSDRLLCPVPWAFDYGYVQLHATLVLGLSQITVTQSNPFAICEAIGRDRPTVLAGLPSLYTYLARGVSPLRQTDRSSLRLLTSSGATIPGPVLRELIALFAPARIFANYGLTESYRTAFLDPALLESHYPCLGRPIPGVEIAVVRENAELARPGEEGEIVHRGDYICLGYWNDDEATARAIRPDPVRVEGSPTPGRALYTGDFGYLDENGFLYFKGRRDHLIKSMGIRVSPGEVEALLHDSGLVQDAAVFGVAHDMLGHEVWAAVSAAVPGDDLLPKLTAYARSCMSPYMTPRRWLIKTALPKTGNGKIDYPALRAEAATAPSARLT